MFHARFTFTGVSQSFENSHIATEHESLQASKHASKLEQSLMCCSKGALETRGFRKLAFWLL